MSFLFSNENKFLCAFAETLPLVGKLYCLDEREESLSKFIVKLTQKNHAPSPACLFELVISLIVTFF